MAQCEDVQEVSASNAIRMTAKINRYFFISMVQNGCTGSKGMGKGIVCEIAVWLIVLSYPIYVIIAGKKFR